MPWERAVRAAALAARTRPRMDLRLEHTQLCACSPIRCAATAHAGHIALPGTWHSLGLNPFQFLSIWFIHDWRRPCAVQGGPGLLQGAPCGARSAVVVYEPLCQLVHAAMQCPMTTSQIAIELDATDIDVDVLGCCCLLRHGPHVLMQAGRRTREFHATIATPAASARGVMHAFDVASRNPPGIRTCH